MIGGIDWFYLRQPILMLLVAIIVASALAAAGWYYEQAREEEYQEALSTLQSTHRIYANIVNDIDLIDQYRSLYNEYRASGLVGEERRLSWIETLESTNQALRLPKLAYALNPQGEFERPNFRAKRGVSVKSSPMELNMGLMHEEDLFALLEGLRLTIDNLFTVESCEIRRETPIGRSLETRRPNLNSTCVIRWVTIDAS